MNGITRFGFETESLRDVGYKEFRLAGLESPRADATRRDVGNGNSFVDVDGNTLCKSTFPAGFHSYALTFYANSRWTSANRSPIRKWRTTTPRNAAVATLLLSSLLSSPLLVLCVFLLSFWILVVSRPRCKKLTWNCNLALLSSVVLHRRADR